MNVDGSVSVKDVKNVNLGVEVSGSWGHYMTDMIWYREPGIVSCYDLV